METSMNALLFIALLGGSAYGVYRFLRPRHPPPSNVPKPHEGWKLKKPEEERPPITNWKELPPEFPTFHPVKSPGNIRNPMASRMYKGKNPSKP